MSRWATPYTFETYGKRDKRIAAALRVVRATQAELDDRKRQLRFEVKSRYVDAVSESLKLKTLDRIVKGNQEILPAYRSKSTRG